jgi:uncharacterized membrane protein YcaP (DUF421 family)
MATHAILATIPHDLFTVGVPLLEKVLRTIAVYLGLLLLLRLGGKRDLAQLNTFDLVVLLLLSNVVQNAVIGNDNSLWGGMVGAVTLIAVNSLLVRVAQSSERAVTVLEGSPEVLARDGELDRPVLRRLGLRAADVVVALRHQGASTVDEVQEAVLKPGGSIVVDLKPEAESATKGDVARLEAKLDRLLAPRPARGARGYQRPRWRTSSRDRRPRDVERPGSSGAGWPSATVPTARQPSGTPSAASTAASCWNRPKRQAPSPASTAPSRRCSAAAPPSTHQYGTGQASAPSPRPVAALSGSA